jgi:hypothetical protein
MNDTELDEKGTEKGTKGTEKGTGWFMELMTKFWCPLFLSSPLE